MDICETSLNGGYLIDLGVIVMSLLIDTSNHVDVCVSLRHNTLSPSILAQTCPSGSRVPRSRVPCSKTLTFPLLGLLVLVACKVAASHTFYFLIRADTHIFIQEFISIANHVLWTLTKWSPRCSWFPNNFVIKFKVPSPLRGAKCHLAWRQLRVLDDRMGSTKSNKVSITIYQGHINSIGLLIQTKPI